MKYGELNLGQVEAIVNKLGGMDGVHRFLAGEPVVKAVEQSFKIIRRMMTLTIGGLSKNDLLGRLKDGRFYVSDWARDIMGKPAFTTLPEATTIELGWVKVRDLGFTQEPTTEELFARIKEVGDLCPAEVGPHLRLADANQLCGSLYWIAMEPISDSPTGPLVFVVRRGDGGGRELIARYAYPDSRRWYFDDSVVFRLRK